MKLITDTTRWEFTKQQLSVLILFFQLKEEDEQDYPPQAFAYEYGGADKDGRHFAKTESKDEEGVVKGEYRVELPDGRVQIVSYRADPVLGYQADVRWMRLITSNVAIELEERVTV